MTDDDNGKQETRLALAVRKALRKLLKNIKSEPTTLVIKSGDTQANATKETEDEIRVWLFRRR